MDFWGTILVLFRRWYIALPAFLLTVTGASAVYLSQPTIYSSSSVLVLTAPTSGATQHADPRRGVDLTNPLLNFDQGLNNAAAILVHALSRSEVADQLGAKPSGDPSYQVTNGTNNPELLINGPFVVITGQSTSPGKAQDLVVRVAQRARQELADRQRELKAPPSTYITFSEIVPPTTPMTERRSRLRPAGTAFVLGLIASISAAFGAESIMTRPRRDRHAEQTAGDSVVQGAAVRTRIARAGAVADFVAQPPTGTAVLNGERQD